MARKKERKKKERNKNITYTIQHIQYNIYNTTVFDTMQYNFVLILISKAKK